MRRWIIIAVAVVAFLAISLALARWLSTDNVERDKVSELLRAQAAGDAAAMAREIDGCRLRPACLATVRANATALRTPGRVEIVAYDSATARALGDSRGPTRVVWKTPQRLTTVQCVEIRRAGNVLSGASVTVTALSEPIDRQAGC